MLVKNWQQSPVHNLLTMFDIRMAELYKEQTRFRNAQTSVYFLSSRIISDFAFRKLFSYKVNAIFSCHREQFYFLWIFFHSGGWYHRQRQVKSFNWKIHFQKKNTFREIMSSLLVRHNSMLCSRSFQLSSCRTPFVMIIEYLKWLWKSIVND